ncbi:MAG: flagellar motor switch phosphatase FliY [Clostridia bacterium]|jgi:flagellar motor switch protein FliN/FliY
MSDILSQEEIDALLNNNRITSNQAPSLSPEEADAIGEIGNISMGTAATTLSSLLNHKVIITTPHVSITSSMDIDEQCDGSYIGVEIHYTDGLKGANLLILKEEDVKTITDLLMGGDGSNVHMELNDLHLSAVGEVMNQMMGSSATSLAAMVAKSINISPPRLFKMSSGKECISEVFGDEEYLVKVMFKLEVENLIDSQMMQLLPVKFAKDLVESLMSPGTDSQPPQEEESSSAYSQDQDQSQAQISTNPGGSNPLYEEALTQRQQRGIPASSSKVNVQPVSFQSFDEEEDPRSDRDNIDLIMDVPLRVTVEVGKARKTVREILELSAGSIIELDKLAGDPVDILVNGKLVAKGEVVVIDDSFGVRVTDIVSPANRLDRMR